MPSQQTRRSRIPSAFQSIFLTSNQKSCASNNNNNNKRWFGKKNKDTSAEDTVRASSSSSSSSTSSDDDLIYQVEARPVKSSRHAKKQCNEPQPLTVSLPPQVMINSLTTSLNSKALPSVSSHSSGKHSKIRRNKSKAAKASSPAVAAIASPDVTAAINASMDEPASPQAYLDEILISRGYSTRRYKVLESGYYNAMPTDLQQASYDAHLVRLLRSNNLAEFTSIIQSGVSTNPCNRYGESLLAAVCKRANVDFFNAMREAGCDLSTTSDDCGRTLLHDCCWSPRPSFDIVKAILQAQECSAVMFYLTDCRGTCPLTYVRRDNWHLWIDFIDQVKDELWPIREPTNVVTAPKLALLPANSCPVADPANALSLELATMVSSGKLSASEAVLLTHDDDDDEEETEHDDTCYDSDDDDDISCCSDEDMELYQDICNLHMQRTATQQQS